MNRDKFKGLIIITVIGILISTFILTVITNFRCALLIDAGHILVILSFVFAYYKWGWIKYLILLLAVVPYLTGINDAITLMKIPVGSSTYALASVAPIIIPTMIIIPSFIHIYRTSENNK